MAFRRTAQARLKQAGADPFEQAEVLRSLRVIIRGMRISEEGRYAALAGGGAGGAVAGPGAVPGAGVPVALAPPSEPFTVDLGEHTELLAYTAEAWAEILDISTLGSFFVDLSGGITIRPYVVEDWGELISFGSQGEITPEDVIAEPDHELFKRWVDIEIVKAIEGPDANLIHTAVTDAIDNTVPVQFEPEMLLKPPESIKFTDWYTTNLPPDIVLSGLNTALTEALVGLSGEGFERVSIYPEDVLGAPDATAFTDWYTTNLPPDIVTSGLKNVLTEALVGLSGEGFERVSIYPEDVLGAPDATAFTTWYTVNLPPATVTSGLKNVLTEALIGIKDAGFPRVAFLPEDVLKAPPGSEFELWYTDYLQPNVSSGLETAIELGLEGEAVQLDPADLLLPLNAFDFALWHLLNVFPAVSGPGFWGGDSGLVGALKAGTTVNYTMEPWRLLDPPSNSSLTNWYDLFLYPRLIDNLDIKTAFQDNIITIEPRDIMELSPDFGEVIMGMVIQAAADRNDGTSGSGPVPLEPTGGRSSHFFPNRGDY
jgi:hypothetical protein